MQNNNKMLLSILSNKIVITREAAKEHDDNTRAFTERMVKSVEKYENEFNDIVSVITGDDMAVSQMIDEVYRSIVNLKFIYEAQVQSRTTVNESNDGDRKITSLSSLQAYAEQEDHSNGGSNRRYSAEWQGFNTNIKIHSKFNGLLKMSKRLRSLTELVIEAKVPIPKLRKALEQIDKIKPVEVKKLIDLTLLEKLLTKENGHKLTNDERNDIVLCLFMAARIVAFEIIDEGKQELSGLAGFKQIYNLIQAWSSFMKIVSSLVKITTIVNLEQYTDYCTKFREALKYMQQHKTNENKSRYAEMIKFLKQSQNEAHQQWSKLNLFKSELNLLIARLKFLELEQSTARELNHRQAKSEVKNVFSLFKMALFGLLVGGNWTTIKVAVNLKNVVERRKERYSNRLEQNSNQKMGKRLEPNEPANQPSDYQPATEFCFHLEQFEQLADFEQTVREIEHELEWFDEELRAQIKSEIEKHIKSVGEVYVENVIAENVLQNQMAEHLEPNNIDLEFINVATKILQLQNKRKNSVCIGTKFYEQI